MVRQEGFEPPTHGLEVRCSIQLSYWRKIFTNYYNKLKFIIKNIGAGNGIRTRDPQLGRLTL